jgi:membrane protein required for beta-lactamase induction
LVFLLPDFGYPVEALWFSCSQILAILFRPFGFLAPRFWLSCLGPLVLPKSGSKNTKGPKQDSQNLRARKPKGLNRIAKIWEQENPVEALWFSCSHILAILFRPFGVLAPRFWLSCLGPLVFLLPNFGYPV